MNTTALKKAIKLKGSQRLLALAIGTNQQAVSSWIHILKRVPARFVLPIEKAVKGAVTRYELRPDIYPKD